MSFLNTPIKSIDLSVTSVTGIETMPWYNPQEFPVQPGDPYPTPSPRDYRWRVNMTVISQPQSSYITRDPGNYNGQDVSVGQWIGNTSSGQAWQIISIEAKTESSVTAIVQDIYRYNTFRDTSSAGAGGPSPGSYIAFNLSPAGLPQIDPVPAGGVSPSFTINLLSRFEYINLQYDYPLYQPGNTFQENDIIAADSSTNSYVLADSGHKVVVGRVTSISDTLPGWFTINPVQKIVDFLDTLPGDIGDIIYSSTTNPGEITVTPGGTQLYVKLRNNTYSTTTGTSTGPTTAGNTFQINGFDVTVGGSGLASDAISAINLLSLDTGVSAISELAPSSVQTSTALITPIYGEPALYAASSYPTATINGVTVTFNITAPDAGYEGYARAAQMAEAINNAGIPDIIASTPTVLVLKIENTAGGAITIVNTNSDINGVPFAGADSGSGLASTTPASSDSFIKLTAVDARPINLLNVVGTPLNDFGLVSVENGTKACGLYIEQGLRSSTSTVVTTLSQLSGISPLIGDQAYVIDSEDSQGNNAGEWSLWLYDGTDWVVTATQDSSSTDAKSLEVTLTPASTGTVEMGKISTGRRVTLITVEVIQAFDDVLADLNIGYSINNPTTPVVDNSGLMTGSVIDLTIPGTYTTSTDVLFGTDTVQGDVAVNAVFDAAGSTTGLVQIIVSYV